MGHDVHTIGNHNLNISSLEALAVDLSKRFKANIEYGIYDTFSFDWDGFQREPSYNYWIFGKICHPDSEKTLWLTDEFYLFHIVLGRYGEDAYRLPYLVDSEYTKLELDEAKDNVCFELRDNQADDNYGIIFNDTFHDWYNNFDSRWWCFCTAFTLEDEDESLLGYVNSYRNEVMTFFKKVGGTEVFYFDDQGESQYLTETYYNWKTILNEIETNFKETTLHIAEFMIQKNRLPRDKFPLAFYDDFVDLRTNE